MDSPSADDIRGALAALIDPLARAARLVLLLDERQPDELRVEALTMPAERLFWTLTQLDDGLPLDVCQALVRTIRLARRRRSAPGGASPELATAEAMAGVAARWLTRRWLALDRPAVVVGVGDRGVGRVGPEAEPPPAATRRPSSSADGFNWLDAPPIVGPPPCAAPDDVRRGHPGERTGCGVAGPPPAAAAPRAAGAGLILAIGAGLGWWLDAPYPALAVAGALVAFWAARPGLIRR